MHTIDESELKHALSTLEASRPSLDQVGPVGRRESLMARRAIEQTLRTSFARAGLDIEKLDRMVSDEHSDQRRRLAHQAAEAVKHLPAAHQAFQYAMDNRRKSVERLAGLIPPPASWFVQLSAPFIIFEKHFRYLIDSHIEPMNSWVKCNVNPREGAPGGGTNTGDTEVDYWFMWENESDFAAVVNVASSLVFTGNCSVSAAQGVFSGQETSLNIQAKLTLWEWWQSPQVAISYGPSQNQRVLDLSVQGGHIFQTGRSKTRNFSFETFGLSYDNMFFIPARATAVFTVSFAVQYSTEDYLNIENDVTCDFASDPNFRIICPGVQLEVLTAPPAVTAVREGPAVLR